MVKGSVFTGLRSYIIDVIDLQAAKLWYSDILGTEPYFDELFYVGYDVAGYELGLHPVEIGMIKQAITYWGVNDIEAVFKELIGKGAKPIENPREVGGEIMVASLEDPFGNPFGIIFNPHFKL